MADTITLATKAFVPIQGNFASPDIVAGTNYSVVVRTDRGLEEIAKVTAQKFSFQNKFSTTVSLPAGTYTLGNTGKVGDIYIVDADSQSTSKGASSVTSTLSFGVEGLFEQQRNGTRG